eukprot:4741451-Amphidinium_carterae.2
MRVNALKIVVLGNASVTKRKLWKVWRAGRLPPVQVITHDLGVHTQWSAWRNPVQQKRISSFRASMHRTRALGLPAHVKARIAKSLFSVGLYVAEVGGISDQHIKDFRASARGALGKGASLRRSAALKVMAHGRSSGDPHVAAELSTVRVWQRRIAAGKVQWPLPEQRQRSHPQLGSDGGPSSLGPN